MDGMPVFVKIEKYDAVLDLVSKIRTKMQDAESILHQIEELKNEEDAQIERWKASLQDVRSKVSFVQQALSQPKKE